MNMTTKEPFRERNDGDLIAAALAGDRDAFAAIVTRYAGAIYQFSYRYVRNGPDAEDVAQETFLRIWKNLKKYDRSRTFTTWLFAIAKNASLDLIKKKKMTPFSAFGDEDDAVEAALASAIVAPGDADLRLDERFLAEELRGSLSRLPEHYRSVLMMRYTDNLKFREIAERLHEPIDTVKSRHRRGIAFLRDILNGEGFVEDR
jgi:RNA polymerase sigma-70 factor (ECF subfamily)